MGLLSFMLGATVGAFLLTYIIAWVVEKFAFRNLPPNARAFWTIGVAWLIIWAIAGWGYSDGGPFVWTAGLYYIPGSLIAWALYRRSLIKSWNEDETSVFE